MVCRNTRQCSWNVRQHRAERRERGHYVSDPCWGSTPSLFLHITFLPYAFQMASLFSTSFPPPSLSLSLHPLHLPVTLVSPLSPSTNLGQMASHHFPLHLPVTMASLSPSLFGLIRTNSCERLLATSELLLTNSRTGCCKLKRASSST